MRSLPQAVSMAAMPTPISVTIEDEDADEDGGPSIEAGDGALNQRS